MIHITLKKFYHGIFISFKIKVLDIGKISKFQYQNLTHKIKDISLTRKYDEDKDIGIDMEC